MGLTSQVPPRSNDTDPLRRFPLLGIIWRLVFCLALAYHFLSSEILGYQEGSSIQESRMSSSILCQHPEGMASLMMSS